MPRIARASRLAAALRSRPKLREDFAVVPASGSCRVTVAAIRHPIRPLSPSRSPHPADSPRHPRRDNRHPFPGHPASLPAAVQATPRAHAGSALPGPPPGPPPRLARRRHPWLLRAGLPTADSARSLRNGLRAADRIIIPFVGLRRNRQIDAEPQRTATAGRLNALTHMNLSSTSVASSARADAKR